jgi:small subunit ribosomal protein S4
MGDPKFSTRKYDTPSHPWQGERIASENEILRKHGLKNKTELWKVASLLRTFRQRARNLQAKIRYGDKQAEKERDEFIQRLDSMGIISKEATLDDILSLDIEVLLTRRLQTLAYLKGLSSSPKQARQFIVHGHVSINGKKVTIPGYMVKRSEEETLAYLAYSPLADDLHPARPKDELSKDQEKPGEPAEQAPADAPAAPSEGVDPSKPTGPAPESKVPETKAPEPKVPETKVPETKEA